MKTRLEYRTNNANDFVLLVDESTELVRSDWMVDAGVLRDFCDCSQDAGDWDDRFGAEHLAEDYGAIVAVRREYELTVLVSDAWRERVKRFAH